MSILIAVLLGLWMLVALLMMLVILMQRPKSEGLGAAFGSGMTDQMFGAQTTNVLQKATTFLGAMLFALTFFLAMAVAKQDKNSREGATSSLVDPADKTAKIIATPDAKDAAKKAQSEDPSLEDTQAFLTSLSGG